MKSSKDVVKMIKHLREKKGLSLEELSKRVGIAKSTLSRYESGQREFPINDIGKYADVLDTTVGELLGIHMTAESPASYIVPTSKEVPLYGSIAAGIPLEMIDVKEYIEIPLQIAKRYPNAFLLTVNGESMNKVVPNGAYALIDPVEDISNGDVVAVTVNGFEATLKRFYKLNNSIVLEPDSHDPAHGPQTFDCTKEECESVRVIGRLVWFMSPIEMKF